MFLKFDIQSQCTKYHIYLLFVVFWKNLIVLLFSRVACHMSQTFPVASLVDCQTAAVAPTPQAAVGHGHQHGLPGQGAGLGGEQMIIGLEAGGQVIPTSYKAEGGYLVKQMSYLTFRMRFYFTLIWIPCVLYTEIRETLLQLSFFTYAIFFWQIATILTSFWGQCYSSL